MPEQSLRRLHSVPLSPPSRRRGSAADAERHARDAPRQCPWCGATYANEGLVVEYWAADDRIFHCWCRTCRLVAEIVRVDRVTGHESM
ncbi:MAG: hypothetical protein ACRDZO_11450 [Egibacteraceae bacterium]